MKKSITIVTISIQAFLTFSAAIGTSVRAFSSEFETVISAERVESAEQIGSSKLELQPQSGSPLKLLPGVIPMQMGSLGAFDGALLWGASSDAILVLLDGVPVNDPTSPSGSFDFSLIDWDQISEIKIVPHGGSVLYGESALAGVIELKSRRSHRPSLSLGYGSNDHQKLGLQTDLGSDSHLALVGERTLGISSASEKDGNREADAFNRSSVFVTHRQHIEARNYLDAGVWYNQGGIDYDRGGGVGADDPNARTQHQYLTYRLNYQFFPETAGGKASISLMGLRTQRAEENTPDAGSTFEFHGRYRGQEDQLRFDNEKDFSRSLRLLTGASAKIKRQDFSENGTYGSSLESSDLSSAAAYLFPQFTIAPHFKLEAGARANCLDISDRNKDCPITNESSFIWEVTSMKIFTRISDGFKTPTLYQRFSSYGNRQLSGERLSAALLGFESSDDDKRVQVHLFEDNYRDQIQFMGSRYQNLSRSQVRGAGVLFQSKSGTSLKYDFAETKDLQTGLNLLRRPKHFVLLQKNFKPIQDENFEVVPSLLWKSQTEDLSAAGERKTLPDYERWDLLLKKIWHHHQQQRDLLSLQVQNIFARKYEDAFGYGVPIQDLFFQWQREF